MAKTPALHRPPPANDTAVPRQSGSLNRSGTPLPTQLRQRYESALHHDFAKVRIHDDAEAARSAQAQSALAFTQGVDVVFGAGQYRPQTVQGQALLAHELRHVQQQSHLGVRWLQRRPPWEDRGDPFEADADDAADLFHARGSRRHGGTLPYRQAMESIIPSPAQPPAAQLPDGRDPVLTDDRSIFDELRQYVTALPGRVRALIASGASSEPWLRADNEYLLAALRVLDRLVTDLSGPRFVVRFDQPAGTSAAASYDFVNDEMHLRRYSGNEQRTLVAIDLVHEYTHILQDRAAESVFARQTAPQAATRAEDLANEIDARRQQVYIGELLRVLHDPIPSDQIFGEQLTNRVFRGQFEAERTATTPHARAAARQQYTQSIETAYAAQLQTNASIRRYRIDLLVNNHALLYWDLPGQDSSQDLGELPETLSSRQQLVGLLTSRVRALPEFSRLFQGSDGQSFATLTFEVAWRGEPVCGFGLQP